MLVESYSMIISLSVYLSTNQASISSVLFLYVVVVVVVVVERRLRKHEFRLR